MYEVMKRFSHLLSQEARRRILNPGAVFTYSGARLSALQELRQSGDLSVFKVFSVPEPSIALENSMGTVVLWQEHDLRGISAERQFVLIAHSTESTDEAPEYVIVGGVISGLEIDPFSENEYSGNFGVSIWATISGNQLVYRTNSVSPDVTDEPFCQVARAIAELCTLPNFTQRCLES